MLEMYLNQKARLLRAQREADGSVKYDDRGKVLYESTCADIDCRRRTETNDIILPGGRAIKIGMTYYLTEKVLTGDLIDGREIMNVDDWVLFGGEVVGYKVMA